MKYLVSKYLFRSFAYGAIMTTIGFFNGKVRYPFDESTLFPPVFIQLALLFIVYSTTFLLVFVVYGYMQQKLKAGKRAS